MPVGGGAAEAPRDLWSALEGAARVRGHRPLVTAVQSRTGARTELSAVTVLGWASKTANLLVEELAVPTGARVATDLDLRTWPAVAWAGACWAAGTTWVPRADGAAAAAASGDDGRAPEVLVVAEGAPLVPARGRPLLVVGAGFGALLEGSLPPGALPWAEEARAQPDDVIEVRATGDAPALAVGADVLAHADVLARGTALAQEHDWGPRDRVLVAGTDPVAWAVALAGVLVARAAVVLLAGAPDADALAAVAAQEAVTATAP